MPPPTTVTRRLFMPGTSSVPPPGGPDLCRRLFQARLGEARAVTLALAMLGAGAHARDRAGRRNPRGVARPTAVGRDGKDPDPVGRHRDEKGAFLALWLAHVAPPGFATRQLCHTGA